jgi:hypothetical protein
MKLRKLGPEDAWVRCECDDPISIPHGTPEECIAHLQKELERIHRAIRGLDDLCSEQAKE